MQILADTHVHLYSAYNLSRAFESAWRNFERVAASGTVLRVLYLTERSNCFFFRELASGKLSVDGFRFRAGEAEEVLVVDRVAGGEMRLVAGRQIGCAQRMEVLALHTLAEFPDGGTLIESMEAARAANAVVVLNWSLGKWMFARGNLARTAIESASPAEVLLGDIAARPLGWGTPRLFRFGQSRGVRTVYGSDPLPVAGEEARIGEYLTRIDGASLNDTNSHGFYRNILLDPKFGIIASGSRNSPVLAARRLWNNRRLGSYK